MRKLALGASVTVILLAIVGLRLGDLRASRTEILRTAESHASNVALILSEYLADAFAAGDASLSQLSLFSRRVGGPTAPSRSWAPSLASARAALPGIGAITVIDRDGVIRHSTRPETVGRSARDDYVFTRAAAASDDNLIVGTPVRVAGGPAGLQVPIGRRLTTEEGEFEGALVAAFVPAETRSLFQSVDVGERGSISVFHSDGILLFREPVGRVALGDTARDNPLFLAATGQDARSVLTGPIEPDGPVLISAFNVGGRPPFIIAVTLDRNEVLTAWRIGATGSAIALGLATLTLAGILTFVYRQIDERAAAQRELARTQKLEAERLREINQTLAATLESEQSARREAEQANSLKDQFLMTVSHELRTPLTAITGWARMLIDGGLTEERRQTALQAIERNASAQTRLIGDLLDVSRVITGRLRLDVRRIEIAGVVAHAIETIRPAAEAKHIRVHTAMDPLAGPLMGDSERLQQVVWNLLSNAVKFTKPGGRVDLTVARDGDDLVITIADDGVGIKPAFLPHVFERFRQESTGTTRRYGGLGLGLSIVSHLVELHGGTVTAESAGEGCGATFTIRLPAVPATAAPPPMPASAPPAIATAAVTVAAKTGAAEEV